MIADAVLWFALFTGTPLGHEHAALLPELTPLAESLGIQERGAELADASFRVLQPADHDALVAALPSVDHDHAALDGLHAHLESLLPAADAYVTSRRKSLYSTWTKTQRKGLGAADLPDRLAARVHVADEGDCYSLLHELHRQYPYDVTEFDDYIAAPKDNGYRSIHTVLHVPTPEGPQAIEVQLRTHAMHASAEHGDAAHWRYKQVS